MTPEGLFYTKDHEWLRLEDDGITVVGITDHAQEALGDITFVELPAVGRKIAAGTSFAVVESVKAASDIFMPVEGTVAHVNTELAASPETINRDPYGKGWICRFSGCERSALDGLMTAKQYAEFLKSV